MGVSISGSAGIDNSLDEMGCEDDDEEEPKGQRSETLVEPCDPRCSFPCVGLL